jgi:hypothetical protein
MLTLSFNVKIEAHTYASSPFTAPEKAEKSSKGAHSDCVHTTKFGPEDIVSAPLALMNNNSEGTLENKRNCKKIKIN